MNKNIKNTIKLAVVTQILLMILLAGCNLTNQSPLSTPVTPTTVCHATGDPAKPYEKITVNSAELAVHVGHASDIIPAPVSGCPTSKVVINDGKIIICHATNDKTNPYEELTISLNGLNGHGEHEGDIFPAAKGGCPSSKTPAAISTGDGKITICHATNSKKNPYEEITVSVNGLNGHNQHEGDIIPAPAGGCPTTSK
jgi:hypothetical protein